MRTIHTTLLAFLLFFTTASVWAGGPDKGHGEGEDPIGAVLHHIGDGHEFHIAGDISLPLPCIAYSEDGFFFSMSSAFEHGKKAVDGYVLHHGVLLRIKDKSFPKGIVDLSAVGSSHENGHDGQVVSPNGVENGIPDPNKKAAKVAGVITYQGKAYELEAAGGLQNFGSSWQDFSITKNVFTMILGFLVLLVVLRRVVSGYQTRKNQSPKGVQSLLEPVFIFLRDEVARPAIGANWEKYFPFILSLFFFILINNLFGLVPFFPGSANVTGNLGTTIVLAMFTFLVVNFSGNKHYWEHVFWMPGVPAFVKLILTPIEVIGVFLKPITLFIRLFANITAGHIIILSLISLIFIFHQAQVLGGAIGGGIIAIPFAFALNILELFVAFLQAFIFSLLTALYIGSAVEEHHHEDAHH